MYRNICVALDTSDHARRAGELALALAAGTDARLVAIHADTAPLAVQRRERLAAQLPAGFPLPGAGNGTAAAPTDPSAPLAAAAFARKVPFTSRRTAGAAVEVVLAEAGEAQCDLLVIGARGEGADDARRVGSSAERLARRGHVDTLVVRDAQALAPPAGGTILCCLDGSPQSYAAMESAIALAQRFGLVVEAVAVYDPYLHYTLFNGIVGVLSEKASKVFKFKDQEKLHEEIIDTGLAKIYQAHLEVGRSVAAERGVDMKITLLDGKAHPKILKHVARTSPWLVVFGRVGVHSDATMDIGATAENLLRSLPCNVLIASRTFVPPIDVRAQESVQWVPEAIQKMERVPSFVRGVARTAIVRWAIERGHSVITPAVINSCMGDVLPRSAAQAMGYVAEEVAKHDAAAGDKTWVCRECGHAARDYRPVTCPVCKAGTESFQAIDRQAIATLGSLDKGAVEEEETFDGRKLSWTAEAKDVLRRVPNGYERRRAKARIEKTAKVRGLDTVTGEFAIDMVQQEVADASYLSAKGERLEVEVAKAELPDDVTARPREGSPLPWTDGAWKRILRVPEGFMRDMTRERVEQFAAKASLAAVNLALCEEGIAEGRRMMAEMLGQYGKGGTSTQAVRSALSGEGAPKGPAAG